MHILAIEPNVKITYKNKEFTFTIIHMNHNDQQTCASSRTLRVKSILKSNPTRALVLGQREYSK